MKIQLCPVPRPGNDTSPKSLPTQRCSDVVTEREFVVDDLPIVLVVEDDQLVQGMVEETLGDGGYELVIASSGQHALELLDTGDGKYRALVTDINLGRDKVDGWEVARHAREIDPEFSVVYMSGDSAADWASKGVPNSIMLSKPFAPAQLLTAVSQLLNSGTTMT
jgi:CheY-like chemotaxis protein